MTQGVPVGRRIPVALCLLAVGSASAFSPLLRLAHSPATQCVAAFACEAKGKVTEGMAVAAVERAEELWAKAIAAREKANALSAEAAELSDTTATQTEGMHKKLSGESTKFSLSMLGDARIAMDTAMDAQKLIAEAVAAAELADQLEENAEVALQVSEAVLEQYERDFPNGE
mmetsp:Transcript_11967/g.24322  ORF Transcript_11967/g.24322 Transcript_11967/m.24322 type:complete len:172 (-) Transcript_11967:63-578(-)|eukprot:CAMPEP_0119073738 /NCGR_PEP_ID=MMETSP1178-20130426/68163_1 /TAXON_ID=33656 /ORGANISM="unid sp, Strain CCMP2000" /LENGTH=171 /DNA_ID=CAMNT_0007055843 /DNA_START=38 /DNA_END=553 /DNA_ORIENTATION=+